MTEQLNVQQMAQRLMTADNILILCHEKPGWRYHWLRQRAILCTESTG